MKKGVSHGSLKMSGVGRVWEGQKRSMKRGLGASWFTRGWEGPGKAQNEA